LDAGRSSAWLPLYSPASKNLHNNGHQTARLARSSANAVLPARVASDIVSKNSDCRTGLLFPAA